jgi:hypothetical protein
MSVVILGSKEKSHILANIQNIIFVNRSISHLEYIKQNIVLRDRFIF